MRVSVIGCSKLFVCASLLVSGATSALIVARQLKINEVEERFRVIGQEIEKLPEWHLVHRTFDTDYFIYYFRIRDSSTSVFLVMNRKRPKVNFYARPEYRSQAISLREQLKSINWAYDVPVGSF